MSDQSSVNHTMQTRRSARDQEQKLDQAATAVGELFTPIMQMWAMSFQIIGDNCSAIAGTIARSAESIGSNRH